MRPSSTDSDTLTVNSYCDPIFSDGFESGDLSGWSSSVTDGGDLSVSPTGALVDGEGMQAVINDNNPIYVIDDTPNAEGHYRAFFYFNPNSIGMANGNNFTLFAGIQGSSTQVLQVQLRNRTGAYQLRTATLTDTAGNSFSSYVTISNAAHTVEVEWDAATALNANDGSTSLWVDGTLQATVSGLDNDTRRIDRAELGAVTGIDAGTRGTLYFDAFNSRRFSYIEPAFVGRSLLPIQPSTEMPTEVPTDKPTPETTENVTETPTPEATEIVTETPTPTEVGTETPTLEATETLTPEPSETGTETPTPELTETVAPPTQLSDRAAVPDGCAAHRHPNSLPDCRAADAADAHVARLQIDGRRRAGLVKSLRLDAHVSDSLRRSGTRLAGDGGKSGGRAALEPLTRLEQCAARTDGSAQLPIAAEQRRIDGTGAGEWRQYQLDNARSGGAHRSVDADDLRLERLRWTDDTDSVRLAGSGARWTKAG